ncbi:hypothetical protein [Phormidium sp. FACHB-1136]|uniref:hypothetical protein n=1 Tax=Phormidium sp. FACHB-1136 TaxID=2692848 RepID=UPI001689D3DB|nr:hypothetical protein [Phormidium sp. FACHB-1136]MBD2425682.1 hypothetical protein [Phormidium sp. FACHB-1136]
MNSMQRLAIGACGLLAAGGVMEGVFSGGLTQPAAAVVGRPATPVSVAGAARRTTRRVIRRSTIYAATLPVGCSSIYIDGVMVYQCGATYYQPYNNQYVVVYID